MKIKNIYLLILLVISPFFCEASAYWMDVKGSGKIDEQVNIRIYYGNIEDSGIRVPQKGAELVLTGEFRLRIVDERGRSVTIPIVLKGDGWEGSFTPHERGVYQILAINDTHPVVDRSKTGGINVRPIDYLCAAYAVESEDFVKKPLQFLDIITKRSGQRLIVHPYKNNSPAAAHTKLRVFNPENWEKELVVDSAGIASFLPTMKGLYIIREDWNDPQKGEYKGVLYTSVRHRCNYFFLLK